MADHAVYSVRESPDISAGLRREFLRQVALRHCLHHVGCLIDRPCEVTDQGINRVDAIRPRAPRRGHRRPLADFPFLADLVADAGKFPSHCLVHAHDVVERFDQLAIDAVKASRHPHGEVAAFKSAQRPQHFSVIECFARTLVLKLCHDRLPAESCYRPKRRYG